MAEYHGCSKSWRGDWRLIELTDRQSWINIDKLMQYIDVNELYKIKSCEIAWKYKDLPAYQRGPNCICCGGTRYYTTDLTKPVIIASISNPLGLKYRLLDGKHRMEHFTDKGITVVNSYITDLESIIKCISYKDPYL